MHLREHVEKIIIQHGYGSMDLLLDYKVFSLTVTVKNGEEAQRGTCRGGKAQGVKVCLVFVLGRGYMMNFLNYLFH